MRRPPLVVALLLALSLLIPFPVVLHAAAAIVQSMVDISCGSSPCTVNFSGNLTTGNAVICGVNTVVGTSTTYACSDATNGTYTDTVRKISSGTGRTTELDEKRNITGGLTGITVTASVSAAFNVYLWEVSGLGASAAQSGSNEDGSNVTTHNASSTGLSATGFGVALGADNNGVGSVVAGSGWTLDSTGVFLLAQRNIGTFSSDPCAYTSAASNNIGVCAIYPETGSGGGAGRGCLLTLLGVGRC